ncbi:hypothetical protein ILUMI_09243 [Ignelater luminosus]|uniref:Uncharacterized protein n=1 Tax=Ignelater luminosus TaxID=2038154 RepID=A0A8K0D046_IGNLU|nr:hypothetical protein ILUMI_09243 [Ignelater luminosus]
MNIVQETGEGKFKCKMYNLIHKIEAEDPDVYHLNVNEVMDMQRPKDTYRNYIGSRKHQHRSEHDILYIPKYCIGIHTNCADYFCSEETKPEVALEQLKLWVWDDIRCAINSLTYRNKSLMYQL